MGDKVDPEAMAVHFIDGKAGAIDADRALGRDIARQAGRHFEHPAQRTAVRSDRHHLAHTIDMARHQMPTEAVRQAQRLFKVHGIAGLERVEVGHLDGVGNNGDRAIASFEVRHCEADALNAD